MKFDIKKAWFTYMKPSLLFVATECEEIYFSSSSAVHNIFRIALKL